jgi:hypothetical protein
VNLKEGTTTVIALVILGITMGLLISTFRAAVTYEEKKDILLYALPLLGAVTGYYFGRVPAERRAEVAEESLGEANKTAHDSAAAAKEAQNRADEANQRKDEAGREKDEAQKKMKEAKVVLERARIKQVQGFNSMARTSGIQFKAVRAEDAAQAANVPYLTQEAVEAMAELEVVSRML